jgi:lipopolysaccharide biosynthesis glycosyltransferase
MSKVTVAMTADSNFIYPLAISIFSYSRQAAGEIQFEYAVPSDWRKMLRQKEVDEVEKLVKSLNWSFRLVECPISAAELPRTLHISPITFVKPAYFDIADAEKVLFLDADTIAVRGWEDMIKFIDKNAIAADNEENMQDFELKWGSNGQPYGWYANAGMLVAKPDLWRERHENRWRSLMNDYRDYEFELLEQDVMNAALLGAVDPLPPEYNYRPAYGKKVENPIVLHYAGYWKPWLTTPGLIRSLNPDLRVAFRAYAQVEKQFQAFVEGPSLSSSKIFWEEARRSVRGPLGLKAQKYNLRGLLGGIKRKFLR